MERETLNHGLVFLKYQVLQDGVPLPGLYHFVARQEDIPPEIRFEGSNNKFFDRSFVNRSPVCWLKLTSNVYFGLVVIINNSFALLDDYQQEIAFGYAVKHIAELGVEKKALCTINPDVRRKFDVMARKYGFETHLVPLSVDHWLSYTV